MPIPLLILLGGALLGGGATYVMSDTVKTGINLVVIGGLIYFFVNGKLIKG